MNYKKIKEELNKLAKDVLDSSEDVQQIVATAQDLAVQKSILKQAMADLDQGKSTQQVIDDLNSKTKSAMETRANTLEQNNELSKKIEMDVLSEDISKNL